MIQRVLRGSGPTLFFVALFFLSFVSLSAAWLDSSCFLYIYIYIYIYTHTYTHPVYILLFIFIFNSWKKIECNSYYTNLCRYVSIMNEKILYIKYLFENKKLITWDWRLEWITQIINLVWIQELLFVYILKYAKNGDLESSTAIFVFPCVCCSSLPSQSFLGQTLWISSITKRSSGQYFLILFVCLLY